MSEATEQAMYDAIEAHFADKYDNGTIRGWIVTIVGQTVDDGRTRTLWLVAPGQILPMSIGLAHEFLSMTTGLDRLR